MNGLSKSENCPQDASIIEEDPFRRVSLQKQSFLEGEKRATNIDGVNKNLFWRYYEMLYIYPIPLPHWAKNKLISEIPRQILY